MFILKRISLYCTVFENSSVAIPDAERNRVTSNWLGV